MDQLLGAWTGGKQRLTATQLHRGKAWTFVLRAIFSGRDFA